MKVLGHWLQRDGGVDQCFNDTLKCIWKAFFANCAGAELSRLPFKARISLLLRSVVPILRFKWTRWPFTISKALHLDAIQRRMIGILLRLERRRDEPIDAYVRRRGRKAGDLQRTMGSWSNGWALAISNWADHLDRPRNAATWPAKLAALRSPEELVERRAANFGRPRTRSASGFVRKRWFESVPDARAWLRQ